MKYTNKINIVDVFITRSKRDRFLCTIAFYERGEEDNVISVMNNVSCYTA